MGRFGRRLNRIADRRRDRTFGESHALRGKDATMLAAARRLLEADDGQNIYETAQDSILLVCDVTDRIGAKLAALMSGLDPDSAENGAVIQSIASFEGEMNPHPYVAGWVPRSEEFMGYLANLGFLVPPDWGPVIAEPPPLGSVLTLLKRDGRGLLLMVNDFEKVAPLDAPTFVGKSHSVSSNGRAHMVSFNREMIDEAIQAWAAEGKDVGDAVVLLIDMTDSFGSQLVQSVDTELFKRGLTTKMPGTMPTVTLVMARADAASTMRGPQPTIADKLLGGPPDGCFWLCCIGYEGASLTASPLVQADKESGSA